MTEYAESPHIDVATFCEDPDGFTGYDVHLVIKSQDQLERRRSLIEAVERGRIGRFSERPVAEGLVVRTTLVPGRRVDKNSCAELRCFREPRGLVVMAGGERLVAEIDRVLLIDAGGALMREYRHPLFAFLHAIVVHPDGRRLLVVSSGYDWLAELDLETGQIAWDWLSWEHGFNPGHDGVWLARHRDLFDAYRSQGLPARLVEPEKLGTHGLMTSARTNHPNSACYHPGADRILATLGHSGEVIEISRDGGWRLVLQGLASMPHGIQAYGTGWLVTDTLRGQCRFLGADFTPGHTLSFANLPGKPAELRAKEWLQMVQPLGDGVLLGLDANRGLILVAPEQRRYARVPIDENWCVHLCVPVPSA